MQNCFLCAKCIPYKSSSTFSFSFSFQICQLITFQSSHQHLIRSWINILSFIIKTILMPVNPQTASIPRIQLTSFDSFFSKNFSSASYHFRFAGKCNVDSPLPPIGSPHGCSTFPLLSLLLIQKYFIFFFFEVDF